MMFQELNKKEKTSNGRNTMRRSIYLFALLSLFVVGCSEQSSVLAPVNNVSTNEPNWIALPMKTGQSLEAQFSTSGWIRKSTDSEFIIDKSRTGGINGQFVRTIVKLKFYSGSVSKDSYVTMTADDVSTLCTFGPSQTFLKSGYLYVKYEGLNLSGIDPAKVKFVYMNTNGVYEYIQVGQLKVDKSTGTLELIDGKIPHFSRYGFVN